MNILNIKRIASLASLRVSEKEEELLEEQLETTVHHVDNLEKINTDHIISTAQVTNLSNVFREDVVTPSLPQEKALENAKKTHNGFFVVPAILEQ